MVKTLKLLDRTLCVCEFLMTIVILSIYQKKID